MCEYMNGIECENELTNINICCNPSDCEYLKEDGE